MFVPLSPERANGSFTSFRNTVTGDFVHEIRENIFVSPDVFSNSK